MTTWYYYDGNGDKIEVTGGQLKGLAKAGLITPDTIVETEDGKKARAGKVNGLAFVTPETIPSEPSPFIVPMPVQEKLVDSPFTATMPTSENSSTATSPVPDNPFAAALYAVVIVVCGLFLFRIFANFCTHWYAIGSLREALANSYLALFITVVGCVGIVVVVRVLFGRFLRTWFPVKQVAISGAVIVGGVVLLSLFGDKKTVVVAQEFVEYVIQNEDDIYDWSKRDADKFWDEISPKFVLAFSDVDEKEGVARPKPAFKDTNRLQQFVSGHANSIRLDLNTRVPLQSRDRFQRELRELIHLSVKEIERAGGNVR